LKSDGTALPPIVKTHGAGHPNTKRIGINVNTEWEKILHLSDCSNCGRRGYQERTCPNPETQTERFLPEEERRRGQNNGDESTTEEQSEDALEEDKEKGRQRQ
jgi:hypothetical protein